MISIWNCEIEQNKRCGIELCNVKSSYLFKNLKIKENKNSGIKILFSEDYENSSICNCLHYEEKL